MEFFNAAQRAQWDFIGTTSGQGTVIKLNLNGCFADGGDAGFESELMRINIEYNGHRFEKLGVICQRDTISFVDLYFIRHFMLTSSFHEER